MLISGDKCAFCEKRQEVDNFLVKIRHLNHNGYIDTQICVPCFIKEKEK